MKLPKWSDEHAVAKCVVKIVYEANEDAEREFNELPWDTHPPIKVTVTAASIERGAIEAAEQGDFKRLADAIKKRSDLSQRARDLIASKLDGTFKVAKMGRPKRPDYLRRDLDPKFWPAEEARQIATVLKRLYPREKGHVARAIAIAAARAGIDGDKLAEYYLRSRHYHALRRST